MRLADAAKLAATAIWTGAAWALTERGSKKPDKATPAATKQAQTEGPCSLRGDMGRRFAMAGVNFDFIIAITLLNSESLVLIFGRSAQVGLVIAMIATALRASQ
jgi:hypothetical protein